MRSSKDPTFAHLIICIIFKKLLPICFEKEAFERDVLEKDFFEKLGEQKFSGGTKVPL